MTVPILVQKDGTVLAPNVVPKVPTAEIAARVYAAKLSIEKIEIDAPHLTDEAIDQMATMMKTMGPHLFPLIDERGCELAKVMNVIELRVLLKAVMRSVENGDWAKLPRQLPSEEKAIDESQVSRDTSAGAADSWIGMYEVWFATQHHFPLANVSIREDGTLYTSGAGVVRVSFYMDLPQSIESVTLDKGKMTPAAMNGLAWIIAKYGTTSGFPVFDMRGNKLCRFHKVHRVNRSFNTNREKALKWLQGFTPTPEPVSFSNSGFDPTRLTLEISAVSQSAALLMMTIDSLSLRDADLCGLGAGQLTELKDALAKVRLATAKSRTAMRKSMSDAFLSAFRT